MLTMRLIDADKAKKVWGTGDDVYNKTGLGAIIRMILDACPDVDAVPVVRCQDCKWYQEGDKLSPNKFCYRFKHPTENRKIGYNFAADDFCSHGERKDGVG